MGPLRTVSGILRWCDRQDFYVECAGERRLLVLDLPRLIAAQADDLLHQRVTLHGWYESNGSFAVHSLASGESEMS